MAQARPWFRPRFSPVRGACVSVAAIATVALSPAVFAQGEPVRVSDGVVLPSQNPASTDNSAAIVLNPANLALMPAPEARFLMVHTGDAARLPVRGYSIRAALPFWFLGSGLGVDFMVPPSSAAPPFSNFGTGHDYVWLRYGLGMKLGSALSVGTTFGWSFANAPRLADHFTVTSGLTFRPNHFLSSSLVVRDWNTSVNDAGVSLPLSTDLNIAFRPINGDKILEVGLGGSYRSLSQAWIPSATMGVELPMVGRLKFGAQMLDTERTHVVATAMLDVNWENLQLSAGTVFGNSLTRDGTGFALGAAWRGVRGTSRLPSPKRFLRLRMESTPTARGHVRVLRTLWKIAEDDEVEGLLLELRASPAPSMAHAEEFVDAIRLLQRRGKRVFCHLESATGRQLYACSAAERIAVNPAGGLRFAGLALQYRYLGGLLRKLGIRADFVRIGKHKLAPEQFTSGSSQAGARDHRQLLRDIEKTYLRQVARGRHMSREQAAKAIAAGPYIATEARDSGLFDHLVYPDELPEYLSQEVGHVVNLQTLSIPDEEPRRWRENEAIAVVYLQGTMIDGRSSTVPLLGNRLAGSYTVAESLKQAREDPRIRAVVFRMETGGGSSLASDVILREARLTAAVKPLIVSMGRAAASGGYYASMAGQEIFANRSTITGSIGIFYGKADIVGLLGKIGVTTEAYRTGPRADAESIYRPFTDSERVELGKKVVQFYDLFVGRVAEGRNMTPAQVHKIAQGKVWTGQQAIQIGLVDHIGGLRQALRRARELSGASKHAALIELPDETPTLFQQVLTAAGVPSLDGGTPSVWLPPSLQNLVKALAMFTIFEPETALAISDTVVVDR